VRGEGRRPDEQECGFGGVDVRPSCGCRLQPSAQHSSLGEKRAAACRVSALCPSYLWSPPADFIRWARVPPAGFTACLPASLPACLRPQGAATPAVSQHCSTLGVLFVVKIVSLPAADCLLDCPLSWKIQEPPPPGSAMPLRDASDLPISRAWSALGQAGTENHPPAHLLDVFR
jgi:hypothetical protein